MSQKYAGGLMTKRKRDYAQNSSQQTPRKATGKAQKVRMNLVFWVLVMVFCVMVVVFVGNRFWTVSKSCTVERVDYSLLDSNSGGIVSQTPVADVYSSDCPVISFRKVPEGFVSLEQLPDVLVPGRSYEFEVGFFRLELLGFEDAIWRGVGVEAGN